MNRFCAIVRAEGVSPGDILPHLSLSLREWSVLRSLALVANVRTGVWVLTAKGHRVAHHAWGPVIDIVDGKAVL